MDIATAKRLCAINTCFYQEHHASFSSSRQSAWPGWELCLPFIQKAARGGVVRLLDLACGNLRFEGFLRTQLTDLRLDYFAVDNCDALALPAASGDSRLLRYQHLDILDVLFEGQELAGQLEASRCDVAVMFGFMHHVPLERYRQALLAALIQSLRPGGFALVTFWQFLNNAELRAKALQTHRVALKALELSNLDEHDFLLSWNNLPGAYRYCHSFSEGEINQFIEAFAGEVEVVSRFASDGRTGDLNTYLVLQKRV
ncbi:MAG: class I SAM-dependent methyltransferase [Coriobacteriales bacterium]|jgi:SAM-dependent methyltransferase|nr:class I SAM-dependent methyltransferase [Coriobacteriales bacterium]